MLLRNPVGEGRGWLLLQMSLIGALAFSLPRRCRRGRGGAVFLYCSNVQFLSRVSNTCVWGNLKSFYPALYVVEHYIGLPTCEWWGLIKGVIKGTLIMFVFWHPAINHRHQMKVSGLKPSVQSRRSSVFILYFA